MGFWDNHNRPKALEPDPAPRPTWLGLLERLVIALERIAASGGGYRGGIAPSRTFSEDVGYVNDEQEAIRELKRALYEQHAGRSLAEDEDPPEVPPEDEIAPLLVAPK